MNILLLTVAVVGLAIDFIAKKAFNTKINGGVFMFMAATVLTAMMVFVISSLGNMNFSADTLGYSLLFALCYSSCAIASILAIKTGPLAITTMITSCSLVLPSLYGIFFLKEPVKITLIIGIIILIIALVLINLKKSDEDKKMSFKWSLFVLVAFFTNGINGIVQKVQQIAFEGMYKNEFMIVALFIVVVVFVICSLFTEREKIAVTLKKGAPYYLVGGIANGLLNLFILILLNEMPASILFPVVSAGGVILTAIVAILIYKESFDKKQMAGLLTGILAIILLNI